MKPLKAIITTNAFLITSLIIVTVSCGFDEASQKSETENLAFHSKDSNKYIHIREITPEDIGSTELKESDDLVLENQEIEEASDTDPFEKNKHTIFEKPAFEAPKFVLTVCEYAKGDQENPACKLAIKKSFTEENVRKYIKENTSMLKEGSFVLYDSKLTIAQISSAIFTLSYMGIKTDNLIRGTGHNQIHARKAKRFGRKFSGLMGIVFISLTIWDTVKDNYLKDFRDQKEINKAVIKNLKQLHSTEVENIDNSLGYLKKMVNEIGEEI